MYEHKVNNKDFDEYNLLIEKLEEIDWALDGYCNDIDCDKFMYKDLLKKKYKPLSEHKFSCLRKLKMQREAVIRLLSMRKFKRFRYKKCHICRKILDTLGKDYTIVGFTKPLDNGNLRYDSISSHKRCSKKFNIPHGWNKF